MNAGPEARLLARLMSDLSEDYWCAGWLVGCEYALWADLTGHPVAGHEPWGISQSEREELQVLHGLARGWIVWSEEERGEVYLSTAEWQEHLERMQAN